MSLLRKLLSSPPRRPKGSYPFGDTFELHETGTRGIALVGRPRSGKTALAHAMFRAAAEDGESGSLIETAAGTAELLRAVAPPGTPVNVFDVTTKDGTAMELNEIITTETTRARFIEKLCPAEGGGKNSNFFDVWAQIGLGAALHIAQHFAPGVWKLAHVIQIAEDAPLTSELGKKVPGLGDVYRTLGHQSDTAKDVQATIVTKLRRLKIYAALDSRMKKRANFLEPLRTGKGWNVFKWSDRYSHVLDGLLSFASDTIVDEALARITKSRHWLGLDEIASYSPLTSLLGAARRGAKSGLVPIVTLHELTGLEDKYGDKMARELMALMQRKIFLTVASPETAKWCSEYAGAPERVTDISPKYSAYGDRPPVIQQITSVGERFNFTWDQVRRQPPADPTADRIVGIAEDGARSWSFETRFLHTYHGVPKPTEGSPAPSEWEVLAPLSDLELHTHLNFPLELIAAAREGHARAEHPRGKGKKGGGDAS